MTIQTLPPYPPLHARRKLPASQLASLNNIVALSLSQILTIPPNKRDSESCHNFIRSYARDASFQVLQALIWGSQDSPHILSDEEQIRRFTLQLAESMASSLDLQTLLDLSIRYSNIKGYKGRLKGVFAAAADTGGVIHEAIEKEFVPALTILLSQSSSNQTQGLYGLRKTAHCILSFLRVSPAAFVRQFSHSKHFVLAIAYAYETSLSSIATSYGGFAALRNAMNRATGAEVDDWEGIWVDTKVALIDAFHIMFSQLLEDLSSAKGQTLGIEAERTFDIIFALLEQSNSVVSMSSLDSAPLTPFLDRSLLADYQQTYSLSGTLASLLKHDKEKDARLDVLESALSGLTTSDDKEPGALKIVLRSYGMQQGIDYLGTRSNHQNASLSKAPTTSNKFSTLQSKDPKSNKGKGKAKAFASSEDPELDIKVTQVLDVLPDLSADYVRLLLQSDAFKGDLEQVLGALLEGSAPSPEELSDDFEQGSSQTPVITTGYDLSERRNVFDDQEMGVAQITVGKKTIANDLLQDHSFVSEMKADILRRAEAILEDEEEEDAAGVHGGITLLGQSNERIAFSPEDELDEAEAPRIKVMGDGEETDESDAEEEEREEETTPETIIELAWIRDPEIFNRDAVTRRSRAREQLRKDTGWAHEQIEGWKVMLDRNPKIQEKIKQKYEYSGNRSLSAPLMPTPGPSRGEHGGGRGGGRGRGRGGRGGGNRGQRSGVPQNNDSTNARERSFKDKHKASRANHHRKRGHDKKMARAGAGIPSAS